VEVYREEELVKLSVKALPRPEKNPIEVDAAEKVVEASDGEVGAEADAEPATE
jgi:hypothetical protein